MHIPDFVISPTVAAITGVVGVVGLGLAQRRLRFTPEERTPVRMGILAAFIFAAQMVNFPVGPGVSGHLMGGALAAVLLGPWAAAVVMFAVLLVQCLLFADGGLIALGANFLNMGLIGTAGAYAIYRPLQRRIGGRRGILVASMAAAWFSVILAAAAFAVELAASARLADLPRILSWMVLVHAAIGVGEALITGLVVRFVLQVRPEMLEEVEGDPVGSSRLGDLAAGLGIALAVAVFLAPLASQFPDGLEFVGNRLAFLRGDAPPLVPTPLADYEVPGVPQALGLATAAAGLLGTLVVFGVGLGLARVLTPPATLDGRSLALEGVGADAQRD